mmetsp:Transcript_27689/g.26710  ORF Transcript_27689/g.26710 Transcript_27689/m.26710 type:complete len:81 (+) Transcript_27689:2-244(+)
MNSKSKRSQHEKSLILTPEKSSPKETDSMIKHCHNLRSLKKQSLKTLNLKGKNLLGSPKAKKVDYNEDQSSPEVPCTFTT